MSEPEDFTRALQTASKGLLYPSDADKPVKAVFWTKEEAGGGAIDADTVRKLQKADPDEAVRTMSVDEFFDPIVASAGWDEEHKTNADRFGALRRMVTERLSDVQAYRIGDSTAHLLLVGKTPTGDIAGVATQVVET